jgi:phosphatidate cytidylyltransferase
VLRARIITALLLLPLVLGAIYLLPLPYFALAFWVIVAIAALEWTALAGLEGVGARVGFVAVLAVLSWLAWSHPEWHRELLLAGAAFWVFAVAVVVGYPASGRWLNRVVLVVAGWLVLLAAWLALVVVRDRPGGGHWLLWLMVLVWAADIGAYFAGRAFGKRKLAPAVSPGKTWEGVFGGAALALVVTAAALMVAAQWRASWLPAVVALVVISVFGDLFESVLKRHRGVKDSGTLLPGHGGALDRADSLLATLPVFALLMLWQEGVPIAG